MNKKYIVILALFTIAFANAQIITFNDPVFKAKLLQASTLGEDNMIAFDEVPGGGVPITVDINHNGEIEVSEALPVNMLMIDGFGITDLTGIEFFTNLHYLNCSNNPGLSLSFSAPQLENLSCGVNGYTTIDLSPFPNLETLSCELNGLTSINLSQVPNLSYLECYSNNLTELDLSVVPTLNYLNCGLNDISSLDLTGLTQLETLYANVMNLTALDVTPSPALRTLQCGWNELTTLSVDGLYQLSDLFCAHNNLEHLDVSNHAQLFALNFSDNPNLEVVLMKNGKDEYGLDFAGLPNLHYVCADESQLAVIQGFISTNGYSAQLNTYCSFTPGGIFYTLSGNNRVDIDANGCDGTDAFMPGLKFNIVGVTSSGTIISDASGNYNIPLQDGTYTITPILENSEYFSISPSAVTVNFPQDGASIQQNFCLTPIGNYSDVEITIVPESVARPGFDAFYKIIYKNKGNTVQSGTVSLQFDDNRTDLVQTSPVASAQSAGLLSWDYTNLLPFETHTITAAFNINSPMEIPAVNAGDILSFVASITPAEDSYPSDNYFPLRQTVVNSLDPNDKTCLEGNTVGPEIAGNEVHYLIRFENTGTFAAQNIVVKDLINLSTFDMASLVPVSGSHPFVTRIQGNKVEFIFENINLSFDDANNDGYVMFKIKTKPTITVGNYLINTALIYFDYNFPVITNQATTVVALLNVEHFSFADYFAIYPNPAKDVLYIEQKTNLSISSAEVYNTLGQILISIPKATKITSLDVSSLPSGNYFLKIHSAKGVSNTKFLKQ